MMTTSTYETRQLEEKLDREASRFLDPIYSKYPSSPDALHVTLTFAQSVDAKIAGKGKKMLPLSCKESMIMTHKLRTMHDGILVGIGTLLNDNPQLNARLLPLPTPVSALPRPIILDTNLRTPTDCKLIKNFKEGTGKKPLIISIEPGGKVREATSEDEQLRSQRLKDLEEHGVETVQIHRAQDDKNSKTDWSLILSAISSSGIERVMIEGGASVISSLLSSTSTSSTEKEVSTLVDTLIITVSPTFVGNEGVEYSSPAFQDLDLVQVETQKFGRDAVFVWEKQTQSR